MALDLGVLAIAEHEGNNITTDVNKILLSGKVDKGDIISFSLIMYQHSNKNTCMHQKPRVLRGKCIKKWIFLNSFLEKK